MARNSVTASADGRNRYRDEQHPATRSPRAWINCRTSSAFIATGFSVSTCLPRSNARSPSPVRMQAGIASTTASTRPSSSKSSPWAYTVSTPYFSAISRATASRKSATATTSIAVESVAASKCLRPITPHPIIPRRTGSIAMPFPSPP